MQSPNLTGDDREWLSKHKEAVRSSMDFMVSDLLYPGQARTMSCAHKMLIWSNGGYINATDLLTKIEQGVPSTQIHEQFVSYVFDDVQRHSEVLSALEKKALIMIAGFDIITAAEIYLFADMATQEAREETYGTAA